jgi:hypothetical protein
VKTAAGTRVCEARGGGCGFCGAEGQGRQYYMAAEESWRADPSSTRAEAGLMPLSDSGSNPSLARGGR